MVLASVQVSLIALGVIFLVLSLLIVLIEILVRLIPYAAPPPAAGAGPGGEDEHLAAIHAAVAHHLGTSPDSIQITNVRSLS